MRITKVFIGIFSITFLIGLFVTSLIKLREAKTTFCPVKMTEIEREQSDYKPKINTNIKSTKTITTSRKFNLEGFWDEANNQNNKYLLETGGVSNIEDFRVKSGETWLGFFGENDKNYLTSSKIRVRLTDESGLSWKEISTRGKEKPLFLVKNLKNVKAGKVKTLFRGLTWEEADERNEDLTKLGKGFSKTFYLNGKPFTLRVEEVLNEEEKPVMVLLLETETVSQIIYYIVQASEEDYVGNLFWVGDLDSDGKLDLFMDFWNYEKGYYSSGLFLSSEAEKGKLVKEFDYFALGGC